MLAAAVIVDSFANAENKHGGSVQGHRVLHRDREGGHERLFQDYMAENPTYTPEMFRRRLISYFTYVYLLFVSTYYSSSKSLVLFSSGSGCLEIFSSAS
jgi:hypothetical protein